MKNSDQHGWYEIRNTDRIYKPVSTVEVDKNDQIDEKSSVEPPVNSSLIPRRYITCILSFFGLFNIYALRINLNVAVVAMTTKHPVMLDNGTVVEIADFNWTSVEKGQILSSFYYGYTLSDLLIGWLADHYGGVRVFGLQIISVSLVTLFLPYAANYGHTVLFTFRALTGLLEGGSFPCVHAIWSKWAPIRERSRLISITLTGHVAANLVCFPVYGFLVTYYGWRILFYVSAISGILWSAIWFTVMQDDPADDSKIKISELRYIKGTANDEALTVKTKFPWKKLLMSGPVWVTVFVFFNHSWAYMFLMTELPTYFSDVWKMNCNESGILISAPYLALIVFGAIGGILADYIIQKKKYALIKVRKVLHTVSGCGTAICILLMGYSNSWIMATIFLVISNGFFGISYGSIFCIPLDIAPKCSGTVMGIMATALSIGTILSVSICGYVVTHQAKEEWLIMFYICIGCYIVDVVAFLIFGTAKMQSWAAEY